MTSRFVFFICLAIAAPTLVHAEKEDPHQGHEAAMMHEPADSRVTARESGQSTFAALIEMTALLEANPDTDWSTVDLDSLRLHLLDMNLLMVSTNASTKVFRQDKTVQFTVSGSAEAVPAIHRMVPAHSRFLEQSRGWPIDTELSDSGATITISASDNDLLVRLKALGFYGFMSLDSHHQAHHEQIALGKSH